MGLNKSEEVRILARRSRVASLCLRGLTQREIVVALANQGFINPQTGQPYSLGTINSDVQALEEEWEAGAIRDIRAHKARIRAELQEAKRVAWSDRNVALVLRALKQETELLGADAPIELEMKVFDVDDWKRQRRQRLADIEELEDILGD